MTSTLERLSSAVAIQAAVDEFVRIGRSAFLSRYGFGKSREFFVVDRATGTPCDSKAIVGAAYGYQYPDEGPLKPEDFSGGEATVASKLESLAFEVVRTGQDWTTEEVTATVQSYFEMLLLEARQEPFNKSEFNARLRLSLHGRSKSSVELKHQNISAVLHEIGLPFIDGYKPRSNAQLLLRETVQQFVRHQRELMNNVVDALQEVILPRERSYSAVVVNPPTLKPIVPMEMKGRPSRLPRKTDYAARDEANRTLGKAGEQWVIGFEQHRLSNAGFAELFALLDWVSENRGDGAGYDILSHDAVDKPRYIEVKTTNGPHDTSFVISRNELDFSREAGNAFYLYRVFAFRKDPMLYMLNGDISKQLHLEPMDYRASYRRMIA